MRLNQGGYKRCVISKTTISQISRERRNRFCRQKLYWTVANHLSSIIFSDETKIMLGNNNKIYDWRKQTRDCDPSALVYAVIGKQHVVRL